MCVGLLSVAAGFELGCGGPPPPPQGVPLEAPPAETKAVAKAPSPGSKRRITEEEPSAQERRAAKLKNAGKKNAGG